MHSFRVFWRFTVVLKWLDLGWGSGSFLELLLRPEFLLRPEQFLRIVLGSSFEMRALDLSEIASLDFGSWTSGPRIPKNYHPKRETALKTVITEIQYISKARDAYKQAKKVRLACAMLFYGLVHLVLDVRPDQGVVEGLCEWLKELQRSCEQWELLGMDSTRVRSYRRPG